MEWINKLKEYAPNIASAVLTGGATLPALAMQVISDVTGTEIKDENQLQEVVEKATPAELLKIKQADNTFKLRMRELDNELTQSELADLQQARVTHQHSYMPAIICCALTGMVAVFSMMLFKGTIPAENTTLANLLFGAVLAKWGDSIAYWVGTTRSSANKDMRK